MSTARRLHYTYDEYRRLLDRSDIKLEYCDGVIYAIAGGTLAHANLSANAMAVLSRVVGRDGRVFSSDAMVRIEASDLSTYPDASVVCGEVQRSSVDKNALVNPTLLVEVTSRSTEDYDRGDKVSQYKQLPSLRAVLIISHRAKSITLVERTASGWSEREARSSESATVVEPAISFAVDDVYAGVELEP